MAFTSFIPVKSLPDSLLPGHYSVFCLSLLITPLILKKEKNTEYNAAL